MEKTNFFYLLAALLFLLIILPISHDFDLAEMATTRAIVYSSLLVGGVWSLKGGSHFFSVGMLFVCGGIVFSIIAASSSIMLFRYGSMLAMLGFLTVAISYSLKQIVFGTELTVNRLVGAICVFLLLGIIWAFAYALLELTFPNSFQGFSPGQGPAADSSWLYFSFVTLTTLGYGDITPVTAVARTLVYMQALAGQFYVAVLVAGLVGAYISDRQGS